MQINLIYQATSPNEFKELVTWLRDTGVPANATVTPAKRDRGPNETKLLEMTDKAKMRLSEAEKVAVESGQLTREEVAAQRIAIIEASELSVAEQQGTQKIESKEVSIDDGEEIT